MYNKNTYLLPQVSPSFHPRTTNSLVDLHGVEILLHHHPDVLSGHYIAPTNAQVPDQSGITWINPHDCPLNLDPSPMATNAFQRKQAIKKDRHSKIFTSQGPRDRRVRLSIGIARKFFDLQEMLGFDKPSKTLDWLLTKSKTAIKELVQMKQKGGGSVKSSSPPNSECEVLSCAENGNSLGEDSKRKLGKKGKDSQNHVKESRAKARARARERTREKMCIKQLNGGRINTGSDLNPSINVNPIQFRNNQLELSAGSCSNNLVFHSHEAVSEDLIQESIVIKRKSKNPSFFGFSSSNYGVPSANASESWDICAILDQHKFINSSSNI